jgi:hypothetical protein
VLDPESVPEDDLPNSFSCQDPARSNWGLIVAQCIEGCVRDTSELSKCWVYLPGFESLGEGVPRIDGYQLLLEESRPHIVFDAGCRQSCDQDQWARGLCG